MKSLYLTFSLLCLVLIRGLSQTENIPSHKNYSDYEYNFSIGAFPYIGVFTFNPYNKNGFSNLVNKEFSHYEYYEGPRDTFRSVLIGTINFQYLKNISSRNAIGFSSTIAVRDAYIYVDHDAYDGFLFYFSAQYENYKQWEVYNVFQFVYRNTLYRSKWVNIYFSLYGGITIGYAHPYDVKVGKMYPRTWISPNYHINYLGISFGKRFPILFELGLGNQGLVKAGFRF